MSSVNTAKNSVSKAIKSKVTENFDIAKDYLDKILPKKEPLKLLKWYEIVWLPFLAMIILNYLLILPAK